MAASIPYYTVEELEAFPHDGNRYELLDGVLLVTPAPSVLHQIIAARLMGRLAAAVSHGGGAHVVGPGAVVRFPRTQLEPDVLVFPAGVPLNTPWARIAGHWLAVEIYSPSSRIYDRDFKRAEYLRLGVTEVWLVDADERTVEVHRANGESAVVRDQVIWTVPVGGEQLVIDLEELFEGMDGVGPELQEP